MDSKGLEGRRSYRGIGGGERRARGDARGAGCKIRSDDNALDSAEAESFSRG